MAVEGTKIREMMEGKTLEKDNIKKMYDMVQNASEPEGYETFCFFYWTASFKRESYC